MNLKIVEAYQMYSAFAPQTVYLTEEEAASQTDYQGMYNEGYTIVDDFGGHSGFYHDYFEAEREVCMREGGVSIGPDYIAIYDVGEEIAYWDEEEWKEEPSLATNLANAVRLYYTKGPDFIRQLLRTQKV